MKSGIITAPVVTYARHRIGSDGQGVTTLVCFHGCPLRCKMCINPFSYETDTKYRTLTPKQLYDEIKKDELYFLATGGGITFGGGEPLLYPDFLINFRNLCGNEWHNCIETSLNVPWDNVRNTAHCIDGFIIDCKDINPQIYKKYTGKDNALMLDNLRKLTSIFPIEDIRVRVPLITNFNTQENVDSSVDFLSSLGIKNIEIFTYQEPKNRSGLFK